MKIIEDKLYITSAEKQLIEQARMITIAFPEIYLESWAKRGIGLAESVNNLTLEDYKKAVRLFAAGKYEIE